MRTGDKRMLMLAMQATCYLDGVDITKEAHTASTEGWADCYVRGPDGQYQIDEVRGEIVEERRYGVVRFEFTAEGEAMMRQWGWG